VLAFAAAGGGEAAVALDEAIRGDAREAFEVVDVLGVVCLQAVLVLQGADEGVGRGVGVAGGEDVAGEGKKCSVEWVSLAIRLGCKGVRRAY